MGGGRRVRRNKQSALRHSCLAKFADYVEVARPVLRKQPGCHVAMKRRNAQADANTARAGCNRPSASGDRVNRCFWSVLGLQDGAIKRLRPTLAVDGLKKTQLCEPGRDDASEQCRPQADAGRSRMTAARPPKTCPEDRPAGSGDMGQYRKSGIRALFDGA